jgi:hypothetical protein
MVISFLVAVYFQFLHPRLGFAPLSPSMALVVGVAITTVGWLVVTLVTPATARPVLQAFYDRIRPMGRGWAAVVDTGGKPVRENVTAMVLCWFLGCVVIYGALFATGALLYGRWASGLAAAAAALLGGWQLLRTLPQVGVTR